MDHDMARRMYEAISQTQGQDLLRDLTIQAHRYSQLRVKCALATIDERREIDDERTRAHNAFIDQCNILSRNMGKAGEDNKWRRVLGDDRKEIGDFACHLVCIVGISAR